MNRPPSPSLSLSSPPISIRGVGEAYARELERRGFATLGDLLLHFPEAYVDADSARPALAAGETCVYRVKVERWRLSRDFRRRRSFLQVKAGIGGESLQLVFFNRPYLQETFRRQDAVTVYGRAEQEEGRWRMVNPLLLSEGNTGVVPLYAPLGALKSGALRRIIANAFAACVEGGDELPAVVLEKRGFPPALAALKAIHMPASAEQCRDEELERLKSRFIYSEFFYFQLELQRIRSLFRERRRARRYAMTRELKEAIDRLLPFRLTADQVAAFSAIVNDLVSGRPMHRVLQGEVGSGKTVVAFLALLMARANGFQGAFLAPTEILAGQHFANAGRYFPAAEIARLSGSVPSAERRRILAALAEGKISVLFGTHALLEEDVRFKDLGLVVIDEQQRFGVAQRAALTFKGRDVDLLVTTATPIPRTLLLTLYRDLEMSALKKVPAGRKPVATRLIPEAERERFYGWLKARIEGGAKGYVILPLIEPSEHFPDLRSLNGEQDFFHSLLDPLPFAMVSGRVASEQKDKALRRFAAGELRLLVATTVIEVGIDVPDAEFIVIENADRYGLSQLHQLRGRVGRGEAASACYLIPSAGCSEGAAARLQALVRLHDGFAISEIDLKMRGGGTIAGLEQSGVFDFRLGDVGRDRALMEAARRDAAVVLSRSELQHPPLRAFLDALAKKRKTISFS